MRRLPAAALAALFLLAPLSPSPGSAWEPDRRPDGGELLELSLEARSWAHRAVPARGRPESRLRALAAALVLPEGLDLREDRKTRSATATFEVRQGNCVGIALLFVAMAREVGIPAYFVLSEAVEGRQRRGDLQVQDVHLAAGFGPEGQRSVFDLGGEAAKTTTFRPISDRTAAAIYYSNRGAEMLQDGALEEALEKLDRAVELAPDLSLAWINLGVVRRRLGDLPGADDAFRQAILLAPDSLAAWRNLALLLDAAN